jgi:copper chaperone NosL
MRAYVGFKVSIIAFPGSRKGGEGNSMLKEVYMVNRKLFSVVGIVCVILLVFGAIVYAQEDIKKHGSCSYCGMNREQFSHSRMFIIYDDGSEAGVCSLHCAAIELSLKLDKTPKSVQVGDFNTKNLIDAEQAFWVIGGNKPGVMTKRAKWAFEKKPDAEAFIKGNGGNLATFDEAMTASYEDMNADTKMIRERRKMKRMQMEKKS